VLDELFENSGAASSLSKFLRRSCMREARLSEVAIHADALLFASEAFVAIFSFTNA